MKVGGLGASNQTWDTTDSHVGIVLPRCVSDSREVTFGTAGEGNSAYLGISLSHKPCFRAYSPACLEGYGT